MLEGVLTLVVLLAWPVTESNSHITDVPALEDFVPLGVEFSLADSNRLEWNGPAWRLSCFISVGIGTTEEGDTLLFQLRLPHPVHPWQSPDRFCDKFYLSGSWHCLYMLSSPMYYDSTGCIFGYPAVYDFGQYISGGACVGFIAYNVDGREWIYKVLPVEGDGDTVEIHILPRGIPYWMGKPEGPYILHGALSNCRDIDIWGGFWEIGPCWGKIVKPGIGKWTFTGHALFDRAYHRIYYADSVTGQEGSPLWFTCGYIYDDDFQLAIGYSENPSPIVPPVSFQHQGRLNFPAEGLSFRFDDYELTDDGGLQPSEFYIHGLYEAGEVHLDGEVFLFYPAQWDTGHGVWWDSTAKRTWGRAFIRWNGFITLYSDTIWVNGATGIFENTRYQGTVGIWEEGPSFRGKKRDLVRVIRAVSRDQTKIIYRVPEPMHVQVKVYNSAGQGVRVLVDRYHKAGTYDVVWDGRDGNDALLPSGVYFVRTKLGDLFETERVLLLVGTGE